MTLWHQLSPQDSLQQLKSTLEIGLTESEAGRRRQQFGANELIEGSGRHPLQIVWEQLSSAMVALLVVAAVVSLFLHEYIDAAAIVAIIILNTALGFFQDYRAERAIAALRKLAVPQVKVRRDGKLCEIPAKDLVPGDIVVLEVGNFVPADGRLLESVNLRLQESSLTGESEPVEKSTEAISGENLPLGDRGNMTFMGTMIAYGHGMAVVTETGMNTELGRIASSLQAVKPEMTPLQRKLAQLGRTLAIVAVAIVAAVFVLGITSGEKPRDMIMTALSLAVAIVPEGLPAVATVALAIGARRMVLRQALIRKLPAVETLGSVTVICSDKTGTLTENRMTATVLDVGSGRIDLDRTPGIDEIDSGVRAELAVLLAAAALCNDAEVNLSEEADAPQALGEPTESALVLIAAQLGLVKTKLTGALPRVGEVAFDSDRKRMTTVHRVAGDLVADMGANAGLDQYLGERLRDASYVAFMKGAIDAVLGCCTHDLVDTQIRELDATTREQITVKNDELAAQGIRVLGIAFRFLDAADFAEDHVTDEAVEQQMVFAGLVGLIDPPRAEAKDAVVRCRAAGIRPIMITGDHPLTAWHIARELGIAGDEPPVVGQQLANMSISDLESTTQDVSVYARVAPADKLHIVQALQNQGQVVAMTGDGVNDAPALKQAHIGVAMGQIGTDVSKEAADMVLMDDNFATIVNAVEEGRIVYDNIRKFVKYTMTSNAGEVCVMVMGPLLGMPMPLLPLQILWVNLVTDGLPGLALAVEPAERETMRRPPYDPNEHIMGRGMWREIAWVGLLMGAVSLALAYPQWKADPSDAPAWRTIVFTVLTLSQMGNAMAIRSSRDSLFQIGIRSNLAILGAVALTFVMQLAVIYVPQLQRIFKTTALSLGELLSCILLSTIVFWAIETVKFVSRRRASDLGGDRPEIAQGKP